jgi:hypothetical protein
MRFKKPKPLSHKPCPAAPTAPAPIEPDILLTANAMVLTTEDKSKFIALYQEYLDEYHPQGPTQRDLVENMVCARWRQRRCAIIRDPEPDHGPPGRRSRGRNSLPWTMPSAPPSTRTASTAP